MAKKLFLLDGMALVYRAHFAFISRPILTSQGVNHPRSVKYKRARKANSCYQF